MVDDQHTVEDLCQTAWLRIVRSISTLKKPESLSPSIYRIAHLSAVDRLQKQYRSPLSVQADFDSEFDETAFDRIDLRDEIEVAIRKLYPQHREVLILHYFESLSIEEISTICGMPSGTTKSRLSRAKSNLKTELN